MPINETLSPGLIRDKLLTDIGSMGIVYSGLFNGQNVIIKQARNARAILEIRKEIKFLRKPTAFSEGSYPSDYGIPLTGWRVNTHFIQPVEPAITPTMEKNGIIVLEPAQGKTLMKSDETTNFTLPLKFHFAALMGWLHALKILKENNITIDSNVGSDLFIKPDLTKRILHVTKIDCVPINPSDKSTSSFQNTIPENWKNYLIDNRFLNMEHEVTRQIIHSMTTMYSHPICNFLGLNAIKSLGGRFSEGNIRGFDDLTNFLTNRLTLARWNEENVVNGDNAQLRAWKGQIFE